MDPEEFAEERTVFAELADWIEQHEDELIAKIDTAADQEGERAAVDFYSSILLTLLWWGDDDAPRLNKANRLLFKDLIKDTYPKRETTVARLRLLANRLRSPEEPEDPTGLGRPTNRAPSRIVGM
jgi:hypothetical protein